MRLKQSFLKSSLLLMGLAFLFQGIGSQAWSELDTIYLANGEVLQAKVQEITGEYIKIKTTTGATSLLKRIQLASRRDILITNRNKKYFGETKIMGAFVIEMFSSQGQKEIRRFFKKKLILGLPEKRDADFIESDSQLQAPAKMFPPR